MTAKVHTLPVRRRRYTDAERNAYIAEIEAELARDLARQSQRTDDILAVLRAIAWGSMIALLMFLAMLDAMS